MRSSGGKSSVSVAVCGSGGAGAMTAGGMLLDAAAAAGFYGLMTRSVGPQIRGGEAAALLRIAGEPIEAHDDCFDILAALDWENVQRFAAEIPLGPDSVILGDSAAGTAPAAIAAMGARIVAFPFKEIAKAVPGGRVNMAALGAVAALIGISAETAAGVAAKSLKKKDGAALEASIATIKLGAARGAELAVSFAQCLPPPRAAAPRWAITGNQAAGLGAVRGGVRFVAAYPITPATEILEWLAKSLPKVGGVLVQAEDELASINMAIGASYGGVPALTATSGPGLSLMTESIGLAVAAEIPLVVVNVMRGGPSTGIPTKSEQADLNLAVYGLHGDAPHIVVAPHSVGDCLASTEWAVVLAERLQVPAIVLSDQFIGQARAVIVRPEKPAEAAARALARGNGKGYARYALTESGVSPMALPGTAGCQYTADGLEHSPRGTPSSQASDHSAQLDKRRDKLQRHDYGDAWAAIDGDGDTAVITWGSTTGAVHEAVRRLRRAGRAIRLVAPRLLLPIQPERMAAALAGVRRALVVEQSHSGQFLRYLRAHYALPERVEALFRPGPLLFRPDEIVARLA
jgi:2-oxoglutarate ferredoxin oxidoreductase subunit alpha